jgi:hypothetical protein
MVEKAPYQIINQIDGLEIRHYPEMILALAHTNNDDSAFGILFNYIQGANKTQKKIKMTAPVISSEKIPMTAPVISDQNYMAFVMPETYTKETIPLPTNPLVEIKIQRPRTLAVLRFSGRASQKDTQKQFEKLNSTLQKHNIQTKGESFLMRYNSPFTPGFIRRNEVAIEIINK